MKHFSCERKQHMQYDKINKCLIIGDNRIAPHTTQGVNSGINLYILFSPFHSFSRSKDIQLLVAHFLKISKVEFTRE